MTLSERIKNAWNEKEKEHSLRRAVQSNPAALSVEDLNYQNFQVYGKEAFAQIVKNAAETAGLSYERSITYKGMELCRDRMYRYFVGTSLIVKDQNTCIALMHEREYVDGESVGFTKQSLEKFIVPIYSAVHQDNPQYKKFMHSLQDNIELQIAKIKGG